MARSIPQIDKDIAANRRLLLRRRPVPDHLRPADWQAAWDAEPALKAIETALWSERGAAQAERDQRDYEAALKSARAIRAANRSAKRCPSCGVAQAA